MKASNPKRRSVNRILIQSAVLGIVGGPIAWALFGPWTVAHFAWSCFAMAIAPPLVDGLKWLRDG